jgi:hypothetical protein
MYKSKIRAALLLLSMSECCSIQATTTTQAPAFFGPTSATYAVGTNYAQAPPVVAVFASGIPTPTITESGALPSGITFSQLPLPLPMNQTAFGFVGTPSAGSAGNYNLALTASNGVSPDAVETFTLTVVEGTVPITSGFTGNWFDADESGHGFSIEVLPDNQMLVQWFVFAPNGGQSWIVATGPITGNIAVLQGWQPVGSGGRFPPNFDPSQIRGEPWGTITFTFNDCNGGTVSWQPTAAAYTSGSLPITRLTMPSGLTCP